MKVLKWLGAASFLALMGIACYAGGPVGPLRVLAPGGSPYMVAYTTGPENTGLIYYLDNQGNEALAGNLYIYGNIFSTGTQTIGGNITNNGIETSAGSTVYAPTNFSNFFSTNSIPVVATYITITSSGGALLMGGVPTVSTTALTSANFRTSLPKTIAGIAGIADGTFLIIGSSSTQALTFQDNSIVAGSALNLGGAGRYIVSSTSTLSLIYNASVGAWDQIVRP